MAAIYFHLLIRPSCPSAGKNTQSACVNPDFCRQGSLINYGGISGAKSMSLMNNINIHS
jgi:hypothetical protein